MGCKIRDLTGKRFGKLTAISHFLVKNKNGPKSKIFWECLCDCGEIVRIRGQNLTGDLTRSCGKYQCKPNFLDLNGKIYGKLTAINFLNMDKEGKAVWLCKCVCGKEIETTASRLQKGSSKNCGKHPCRADFENLAGSRYGTLTVTSFDKTEDGEIYWNCLCDCGNTRSVTTSSLNNGGTITCTDRCNRVLPNNQALVNKALTCHKLGAENRGLVSHLTVEQYREIAEQPCVYCGEISIRKNRSREIEIALNSVDRRDNEPFYTLENSQSTCFDCQTAKMDKTHIEFLEYINRVHKYQNRKL